VLVKLCATHAVAPDPTTDSESFWTACNEGRLLLRQCRACGHTFYYPRLACPRCGRRELSWIEAAGRGVVYSYTSVHTSFYGRSWEADLPYTVLLVDLVEGPRMLSRLVGEDDRLWIGAELDVDFTRIGERRYPYFRLAAERAR
jgi:uncharacterized OB-fold protein